MAHLNEVREEESDRQTVVPIPRFRQLLITVIVVALGLVLVASYSYFSFNRLLENTIVRFEAVSAILLETTESHLWFEEILVGDENEDISVVWFHLDQAEKCACALFAGGDIAGGHVTALPQDQFGDQIQEILSLLQQFRAVAQERFEHAATSRPGSRIDQQFDHVFDQLITSAKILDLALHRESGRELSTNKAMQLGLIVLYLILAAALITVLYRYDRNQTAAAALISRHENQLRQVQKMEAVGNLARGIAHDFNNLLQAIIGYGEVLAYDLVTDGKNTDEIDHILKAGHRAADLTQQLLTYSRRQVIAPQDLNLNDLIANLIKMLQRLIGENIILETTICHQAVTIFADKTQMEQIVMNLCLNGRDAIVETGVLTIETETVNIDDTYCADHPWAEPGAFVLLTVTDNGCGMEQTTMNRIFEPFYTTKAVGKGTGLGLSTVYGIVKQNDGIINVYSEIDHGSKFKIYWPLVSRSAAVDTPTEIPATLGGTETILVAEDDDGVRDFVTGLLEDNGYRVFAARDGQEAIDLFDAAGHTIDLALLDVVMPRKSGREVMEHLRRADAGIPIIFTSGYSLNAIHTDFVLAEGIDLLEKPYRRHEFLTRIRQAVRTRK